ncbi:Pyridoxal 5'-phosphate synthase subunit snz1 [Coemansia sp. RSA 2049]|nr:Pyridoxal 5'-phosphate synthase subunit snz1 [Coemansia sp. RSA 1939]KAJ2523876.1 Pyridoxal 5'-phosphate synthase subunit snz1 [Coemansia sp. RSA 2049]KAJ2615224.1 Pyridoxal 5'-phosphate synthase subunit snz1 [Coemansia sp. RSA 1804]
MSANNPNNTKEQHRIKICFANQLKGGAIFSVSNKTQALSCESAGAIAVIAVDHRTREEVEENADGVTRMIDPSRIKDIMDVVAIPVFGRVRIGHEMEARIVESIKANGVDEHEMLTAVAPGDRHIKKRNYKVPFMCGASDLGEALRRIQEGASMIRIKGNSAEDTANLAQAVEDITTIQDQITRAVNSSNDDAALRKFAEELQVRFDYLKQVAQIGRLPVPVFGSGGIVQPSDAAYMIELGCDGVVVSNRVFAGSSSQRRIESIVRAVENPNNYELIAALSEDLSVPDTE